MKRLAPVSLAVLVIAGCGGGGSSAGEPSGSTPTDDGGGTVTVQQAQSPSGGGNTIDARGIYERESPGVVTVISLFGEGEGIESVLSGGDEQQGLGSGFVISRNGEIATNAHVVTEGAEEGDTLRKADQVFVQFADGNQVEAKIVGADPNVDVALLKIDPADLDLAVLPLADSEELEVGDPVAAIGSPYGEQSSLSVGVISGLNRTIDALTGQFGISGAIQTDAAINRGNSGGPLIDSSGSVIGINSQIQTTGGGGEGVGFAVPANTVKRSLDQLREDGTAEYAYLGVSTSPVFPQLAERFDLGVDQGAWVQVISPGGPAEDADLVGGGGDEVEFQTQAFRVGGDVITAVDGTPVRLNADLSEIIAAKRPGEKVELEIVRDGDKQTVELELGDRADAPTDNQP